MYMKVVVRQMQKRRVQEGLSLRALAPKIGISFSTLSRLERGGTPDVKTVAKIEKWVGIKPKTSFTKKKVKSEGFSKKFQVLEKKIVALNKRVKTLESRVR